MRSNSQSTNEIEQTRKRLLAANNDTFNKRQRLNEPENYSRQKQVQQQNFLPLKRVNYLDEQIQQPNFMPDYRVNNSGPQVQIQHQPFIPNHAINYPGAQIQQQDFISNYTINSFGLSQNSIPNAHSYSSTYQVLPNRIPQRVQEFEIPQTHTVISDNQQHLKADQENNLVAETQISARYRQSTKKVNSRTIALQTRIEELKKINAELIAETRRQKPIHIKQYIPNVKNYSDTSRPSLSANRTENPREVPSARNATVVSQEAEKIQSDFTHTIPDFDLEILDTDLENLVNLFEKNLKQKNRENLVNIWNNHPLLRAWLCGREIKVVNHQSKQSVNCFISQRNSYIYWYSIIYLGQHHLAGIFWDNSKILHETITSITSDNQDFNDANDLCLLIINKKLKFEYFSKVLKKINNIEFIDELIKIEETNQSTRHSYDARIPNRRHDSKVLIALRLRLAELRKNLSQANTRTDELTPIDNTVVRVSDHPGSLFNQTQKNMQSSTATNDIKLQIDLTTEIQNQSMVATSSETPQKETKEDVDDFWADDSVFPTRICAESSLEAPESKDDDNWYWKSFF